MALPSSRAKNAGGGLPAKLIAGDRKNAPVNPAVRGSSGVGAPRNSHTIGPIKGRVFKSSGGHGASTEKAGSRGLDRRFGNGHPAESASRHVESVDCDDYDHSMGGGK